MKIANLETPALIVEKKIFDKNAQKMKDLLQNSNLALRPHYKSHKCASIANFQIKNGAKGMTCAKLSEAIDLADSGVEDILIANQIVEPQKVSRLSFLAKQCKLTVCVDNKENIEALESAAKNADSVIGCLVEFDIGMERCGVTDPRVVLELAKFINEKSNLEFRGIQAYAGHVSHMVDFCERKQYTEANNKKLTDLLALLEQNGLASKIVSGGSTGTAEIKAKEGIYNELQAGSYLFMDSTYATLNLPFENSLFILTTVVSRRGDITVVDAGVKTCGVDQGMPAVKDASVCEIVASEEHFQLHGLSKNLKVGDKLFLIPGHCCSTVNLHDKIYVVEDEKVVNRIEITAKGIGK